METTHKKSFFVCFEGIDGGGKTSVINNLLSNPAYKILPMIVMPEFPPELPSLEIHNALDKSLFVAEQFYQGVLPSFFYLAYARSLCIQSTLDKEGIILIDRYIQSLVMYQGYFLFEEKKNFNLLKLYNNFVELFSLLNLPLPNITLYFDAPLDILIERLSQRENRKITDNEIMVLNDFKRYYSELIKGNKENCFLINTDRKFEDVTREVYEIIQKQWKEN